MGIVFWGQRTVDGFPFRCLGDLCQQRVVGYKSWSWGEQEENSDCCFTCVSVLCKCYLYVYAWTQSFLNSPMWTDFIKYSKIWILKMETYVLCTQGTKKARNPHPLILQLLVPSSLGEVVILGLSSLVGALRPCLSEACLRPCRSSCPVCCPCGRTQGLAPAPPEWQQKKWDFSFYWLYLMQ